MRSFLAAVVIIGLTSGSMGARPTFAEPDSLEETMARLVRHGFAAKRGLALGVRVDEALGMPKGGVTLIHEGYAPLSASGWPVPGSLAGVIRFSGKIDGERFSESPIDAITLEILVPAYDRVAMKKLLVRVIKELGLETTPGNERHTYFTDEKLEGEAERVLWFALGERLIVLDFDEDGRTKAISTKPK